VRGGLQDAGFAVQLIRYMGRGLGRQQPLLKRRFKRSPVSCWLSSKRLLASTRYFVARTAGLMIYRLAQLALGQIVAAQASIALIVPALTP
jgi:hypothetical protein